MGFNTRQKGTYFTILNGKFCQRVEPNTSGAIARVNKVGNTVYEVFHDSFVGKLVNIDTKDSSDYGKSWLFVFKDEDGDFYTLQLSYSNSFAVNFLKMLPNIKLDLPFEVSPSTKMVDGKQQSSLFIKQGGENVKHAYTRDNPNGMPDLEKIRVSGKETWDDSKRLDFLFEMVKNDILPKLDRTPGESTPNDQDVDVSNDAVEEENPF